MAKLIERESVERDYGMSGTNAIIESNAGTRMLVCDAFGGVDTVEGGAVRWRHGMAIILQPGDTFESLRAGQWNDEATLWDAVVNGHDDSRPVWESASPESLAKSSGIA